MNQPKPHNELTGNQGDHEALTRAEITARIDTLDRIVESKDALLARMHPYITELMVARHGDYEVPDTLLDKNANIARQLYKEPTYNDQFVHGVILSGADKGKGGDLDARRGGEFHTAEKYEHGWYAKVTLKAARALGFVAPDLPLTPSDPIDAQLGIADSYLEPIEEKVEAIIIPTAKSISNPMRVRDALRNIESGKIHTAKIILASCDREVEDAERAKLDALGLHYGSTEFGSAIASFNDFAGTDIDPDDAEPFFLEINGIMREGKKLIRKVELPSGTLELIAVSAPFDPTHKIGIDKETGDPIFAVRANTEQNLLAANEFLSSKPGLLVLESHDTWSQSQAEIADQVLGPKGKQVIPTGPFKLDRLRVNEEGKLILNNPGEVVDEIAKTYAFATKTRISALNAREAFTKQLEAIH
jgi:hypothetical protein